MDSTSSIQQALVASPKHILDAWTAPPSVMNGYRRAETWDKAADFWRTLPIPTWEDDEFLQLIAKHHAIDSTSSVLDIGCGSGIYSFALAKRAKHVVGIDISSKMIEAANDRKEELGIENVQFIHDDFLAHAFTERFDVVIAHMTPAMRDGEGFRKMLALTKRFGFTARPTPQRQYCRRHSAAYLSWSEASKRRKHSGAVPHFVECRHNAVGKPLPCRLEYNAHAGGSAYVLYRFAACQ